MAAAVVMLSTGNLRAAALEDRDWIEVRSANFSIRSAIGEKVAVQLARNLEHFRAAVGLVTNLSSTESSVPIRVYLVDGRADIMQLGVDADVAGFIHPTQRAYNVVLRNVQGMSEIGIVLHEYVHYLIRNHNGLQYPKWYDEGFAEYLGSSGLRGKYFLLGRPNKDRAPDLQYGIRMPLRTILRADLEYESWSSQQRAMFYAQSWALVHYLQTVVAKERNFSELMAECLKMMDAGLPGDEAFAAAFGLNPDELGVSLNRYLDAGRFAYLKIEADALVQEFAYTVEPLAAAPVALGLADIAALGGADAAARGWYAIAAADPQFAGPAQLRSGLLNAAAALPEFESEFDGALALCPDDAYCQLDYANYLARRANVAGAAAETELINRARQHYVKAWRLNDSIPEVYAAYGQSFLRGERDADKAVQLLDDARYLLSSNLEIRFNLGRALAAAGRRDEAIAALRSVVVWSHSGSALARKAAAVLQRLEAPSDTAANAQ
jgi:tetratricopeptide (TPR) repeat protein